MMNDRPKSGTRTPEIIEATAQKDVLIVCWEKIADEQEVSERST